MNLRISKSKTNKKAQTSDSPPTDNTEKPKDTNFTRVSTRDKTRSGLPQLGATRRGREGGTTSSPRSGKFESLENPNPFTQHSSVVDGPGFDGNINLSEVNFFQEAMANDRALAKVQAGSLDLGLNVALADVLDPSSNAEITAPPVRKVGDQDTRKKSTLTGLSILIPKKTSNQAIILTPRTQQKRISNFNSASPSDAQGPLKDTPVEPTATEIVNMPSASNNLADDIKNLPEVKPCKTGLDPIEEEPNLLERNEPAFAAKLNESDPQVKHQAFLDELEEESRPAPENALPTTDELQQLKFDLETSLSEVYEGIAEGIAETARERQSKEKVAKRDERKQLRPRTRLLYDVRTVAPSSYEDLAAEIRKKIKETANPTLPMPAARALNMLYCAAGGLVPIDEQMPETGVYGKKLSELANHDRYHCLKALLDAFKSYLTKTQYKAINDDLPALYSVTHASRDDKSVEFRLKAIKKIIEQHLSTFDIKVGLKISQNY